MCSCGCDKFKKCRFQLGKEKKSHGASYRKVGWMLHQWDLVFHEKCLDREEVVSWCVVVLKNPRAIPFICEGSSESHYVVE